MRSRLPGGNSGASYASVACKTINPCDEQKVSWSESAAFTSSKRESAQKSYAAP